MDSYFAGNRRVAGSGTGARLEYADLDPSFLELVGTKVTDEPVAGDSPLLVVEFGAGFNTPGVIRWLLENVVYHHPRARFVRVNPEHPEVPKEITERSLAWEDGAAEVLAALTGS